MSWAGSIQYIRLQVDGHTVVDFVNGSRACSCGLERGETPNLRRHDILASMEPKDGFKAGDW